MIAEHQDKWIIFPCAEPDEKPHISFSNKPDVKLRRNCFLLFILIFTAAMVIVAQNDQLVQTGYKLVEMKEYAAELEKENQTLRIDIAKLKSTERIGDIAINQLGLVLPDAKYISTSR